VVTETSRVSAPEPGRLGLWVQAVRYRSFTASVIPIAIGCALALFDGSFTLWLALVMLLATVATHAGSNLANDYFDHLKGVDTPQSYGQSRLIQMGVLTPRQVIRAAVIAFAIATVLGLIVVAETGWEILALALVSLAAAVLYTGGPKPLGYIALGEATVFIFMGLVTVMGSYYVLTGEISWRSALVAAPIGFLTAAHLHANNLRDIPLDREAGKITLATFLGRRLGNWEYFFLLGAAYVTLLVLVVNDPALWPVLITGASLPVAFRLVQLAFSRAEGRDLNPLLRKTAGLHLRFGSLMLVGLLLATIIDRVG
jgi:1,4-dihydroxy-2-naphthoate octaprenyltransferase